MSSGNFGYLDWTILLVYFVILAAVGPYFAKRNKSTETYFLGNREFPAWILGLAMFATSISSISVLAYPADAFKTAYIRLLPCLMLPFGVYIGSRWFLPYYRRTRCTSVFEFLESRFSPGIRGYASATFLLGQVARVSTILYLVSMVFQQMTGYSPYVCIFIGGMVIATYTVLGGIKAIIWTQVLQAGVLWFGAILCFYMVVSKIDGGFSTIFSMAWAENKLMPWDLNPASGKIEPLPWVSLQEKAIVLMLINGLFQWIMEYSTNQNVIQKYCAAKNPKEATKAIWICCCCSVPAWTFFMLLGTSLWVYFKLNHDPYAMQMLTDPKVKPEGVLPYFCVTVLPTGVIGLVIAGILSAAMSASASSINAISAISITDIYRRHIKKDADEKHYVLLARIVSAFSVLLMMGGATLFLELSSLSLQDLGVKLGSILCGGLVGLYMLGFLTTKGSGRAVMVAIILTVTWLVYCTASEWKWVTPEFYSRLGCSDGLAAFLAKPVHTYYAGLISHFIMMGVGYFIGLFEKPRDLTNLTIWTTTAEAAKEAAEA